MDDQQDRIARLRSWTLEHPWHGIGLAACVFILVGVLGSVLTGEPIRWLRTIGLGLLLALAFGAVIKARR